MLLAVGLLGSAASAQEVLIYGPSQSGTGSNTQLTNLGMSVTVVDAFTWCSLTTAQFEAYDALFFDGALPAGQFEPASCADALAGNPGGATWAAVVLDSEPTWGPAVELGPIYVSTADSSFHTAQLGAQRVIQNAAWWATSEGSTGSGGATGLVLFTGGLEMLGVFLADALFDTLGDFTTSYNESEGAALLSPGHPAQTTPNLLGAADYIWGNLCHGSFDDVPVDATPLAQCTNGAYAVVALPEPSLPLAFVAGATLLAGLSRRRAARSPEGRSTA